MFIELTAVNTNADDTFSIIVNANTIGRVYASTSPKPSTSSLVNVSVVEIETLTIKALTDYTTFKTKLNIKAAGSNSTDSYAPVVFGPMIELTRVGSSSPETISSANIITVRRDVADSSKTDIYAFINGKHVSFSSSTSYTDFKTFLNPILISDFDTIGSRSRSETDVSVSNQQSTWATAAVATHVALSDPHTQYLKEAEAASTYLALTTAAANYLSKSEASSLYVTPSNVASYTSIFSSFYTKTATYTAVAGDANKLCIIAGLSGTTTFTIPSFTAIADGQWFGFANHSSYIANITVALGGTVSTTTSGNAAILPLRKGETIFIYRMTGLNSGGSSITQYYALMGTALLRYQSIAFSAYMSATQTITTSGTNQKLQFNTTDFTVGSGIYDTVNYRFTPPAGYYQVTARYGTTQATGITGGESFRIMIYKNGAEHRSAVEYPAYGGFTTSSGVYPFVSVQVTSIIQITDGDYIEVYARHDSGSAKTIDNNSITTRFEAVKLLI